MKERCPSCGFKLHFGECIYCKPNDYDPFNQYMIILKRDEPFDREPRYKEKDPFYLQNINQLKHPPILHDQNLEFHPTDELKLLENYHPDPFHSVPPLPVPVTETFITREIHECAKCAAMNHVHLHTVEVVQTVTMFPIRTLDRGVAWKTVKWAPRVKQEVSTS